jgi:hypothetical protein
MHPSRPVSSKRAYPATRALTGALTRRVGVANRSNRQRSRQRRVCDLIPLSMMVVECPASRRAFGIVVGHRVVHRGMVTASAAPVAIN